MRLVQQEGRGGFFPSLPGKGDAYKNEAPRRCATGGLGGKKRSNPVPHRSASRSPGGKVISTQIRCSSGTRTIFKSRAGGCPIDSFYKNHQRNGPHFVRFIFKM